VFASVKFEFSPMLFVDKTFALMMLLTAKLKGAKVAVPKRTTRPTTRIFAPHSRHVLQSLLDFTPRIRWQRHACTKTTKTVLFGAKGGERDELLTFVCRETRRFVHFEARATNFSGVPSVARFEFSSRLVI